MTTVTLLYNTQDWRWIFVMCDDKSVLRHLEDYLNKIPNYMFLPSFTGMRRPVVFLSKKKLSDGRVIHYCSSGLWNEIRSWCLKSNITCEGIYEVKDYGKRHDWDASLLEREMPDLETFKSIVDGWDLSLPLRPYQYQSAYSILTHRTSLSELATRAGKTLIAYIVFRWMMEYNGAKKILMIVPNISLVKQGVKDMADYKEFFSTETVWSKGEYCDSANLTIGTFQSLIRRITPPSRGRSNKHYDPHFFDKYDVICVDEAHKADCDSITTILSQSFVRNAKIRFGFSGTLPRSNTIESFGVQALLGPCVQNISTMELVDEGYLAKPDITQIRVRYSRDLTDDYILYGEYLCSNFVGKKHTKVDDPHIGIQYLKELPVAQTLMRESMTRKQYADALIELCKAKGSNLLTLEQMIAMNAPEKMNAIAEVIRRWDKNGIVFAHNEEYIDFLYDSLSALFPERTVYKIKGKTSVKQRETIRQRMNTDDSNAILVASYGCVGTGLTFTNIAYCVLAQSFKSEIINLQSIGRGLLLGDGKDTFYVYDLIDVLPTNRLLRHGIDKVKTYKEHGYPYKVRKIG